MVKRSSVWLFVLISILAIGLVATGCAKKQVVKEEAAAKPAEAKKGETGAAASQQEGKSEEAKAASAPSTSAPSEAAKQEAAAPAAASVVSLDPKDLTIWFAFDDYNLSSNAKENLEKIAAWMSKNSSAKIEVQGNTCNLGTAEYNLALGDRRANSAKKYLVGLGVNGERLSTISFGLEKPIAPNTDEYNRSKNRRDEFRAK